MNKKDEIHLSMIGTTIDYCEDQSGITDSLPEFSTNFSALKTARNKVNQVVGEQAADGSGAAAAKTSSQQALAKLAADTCRKLVAFATIGKDKKLLKEIAYTENELLHLPDTVLADTCQMVHDRAQANLVPLAAYLVDEASQTTLQAAITAYRKVLSSPRLEQVEKSQQTKQLTGLFAQADEALANMDVVVEIVRLSQPDFYAGYKLARRTIDTGVRKMALKALVSDTQNVPLKGVAASFWPNGDSAPDTGKPALLVKKTAGKGGFYVKNMKPGSYLVTLKKAGYAPQNHTVYINDGEMTVLEAAMQAL